MILCQYCQKICHRSLISLSKCAKIDECSEINVKKVLIKKETGKNKEINCLLKAKGPIKRATECFLSLPEVFF